MRQRALLFVVGALLSQAGWADSCATRYSQLASVPAFSGFRSLMGAELRVGLLNETKGSYVLLEARTDDLYVVLYSTGPFDLFGIRKESPLRLCETQQGLTLEAFGRRDHLSVGEDRVSFGTGGPRYRFMVGEMTPLLKRMHAGPRP